MKVALAERLHEIMSESGLRQTDIIERAKPFSTLYGAKISRSDLSQYCSGRVEPAKEKLFLLAAALDVDEAWLLGYDVPRSKHSEAEISPIQKGMVARIKQLCDINGISIAKFERTLGFANGSIVKTNENTAVERIHAIAEYFQVSMEYIYSGNDQRIDMPFQELYSNKNLRALLEIAQGSQPEDIKVIADLLQRLNSHH